MSLLDVALRADRRADLLDAQRADLIDLIADLALECHRRGRELDRWKAFGERLYRESADRGQQLRRIVDGYSREEC